MRAIRLFAGEKHHAKITVTKWAALCEYGDEYAQHDTPQCYMYQCPDAIPAAAAVQAQRLLNKLNAAQDQLSDQHTELDTQAQFLETNQSQLESTFYSLNTELNSVEKIDEVEAILTLVSAQTSYNAAIQVGANVVPQSLMDYLN